MSKPKLHWTAHQKAKGYVNIKLAGFPLLTRAIAIAAYEAGYAERHDCEGCPLTQLAYTTDAERRAIEKGGAK